MDLLLDEMIFWYKYYFKIMDNKVYIIWEEIMGLIFRKDIMKFVYDVVYGY